MRQKEPIARDAMKFASAVHKLVDTVPGAEESGDAVAVQLIVSAMMIGPKYAGIVRGLDRGNVLDRLELCCGNADEAVYWLEYAKTYWPTLADDAGHLQQQGLEISRYMHRRKEIFSLGLNEIDGEVMPWAPYRDDEDDFSEEFEDWSDEPEGEGEEPD